MDAVDTPEGIAAFQQLALRGALKLETKGLKRRGKAASQVVREFLQGLGLKAPKDKVKLLQEYEKYLLAAGVLSSKES